MTRKRQWQRIRHGAGVGAGAAAAAIVLLGTAGNALAAPRAVTAVQAPNTEAGRAGHATGTLADGPAIPASWAPVTFRGAQLSVPGRWLVETPHAFWCAPHNPGMIFAGSKPAIPKRSGCGLPANLAWIAPARHGVRVGAKGPLARQVLATLTRSPLSVVLAGGPATPVPAGWAWHRFGGVRFATPRAWNLQRENRWATCGTGLNPRSLVLIDAKKPPLALPCPFLFPTAAAELAHPGLTVVTGKYAARSVGRDYARCQVRNGSRICLSTLTGQGGFTGGVLIFRVSHLHQREATYFLLGLPGPGAGSRAIFDSVTPVR